MTGAGLAVILVIFYLALFAFAGLAFIGQVMLGISVNRDAQALGLTNGKLFMILTIFFGGIPAGIYLIIRANKVPNITIADFTASTKFAKKSIILTVLGTVLTILCCCGLMAAMLAAFSTMM